MPLKYEERGAFETLLELTHVKPYTSKYRLVFETETIDAICDGDSETDNCLDLDDPAYEEYWMIVFRNLATGKLFEVNYHNMPKEVWCDGEKVPLTE